MSAPVKFGVLGCAEIAKKVCVAIAEASNAECVAVASRSKEKAEAFVAANCPGARAYGSYDELLSDADVQVVYLPLPSRLRGEWAERVVSKKKHILCETPAGCSMRDVRCIVVGAHRSGVQFMDNTMFMHHERLPAMRKVIDDTDRFGQLCHVGVSYTVPYALDPDWAANNIRMNRMTEPYGCLGDMGWVCARFVLWVYGYVLPESVSCHFLEETGDGNPVNATAFLKFSGGRTARFECGFKQAFRQYAEVVGTKQVVSLDDFVIPWFAKEARFNVSSTTLADKGVIAIPTVDAQVVTGPGCVQHTRVVEKMANIVQSGKLEDFWATIALQTNLVLSALVKSARQNGDWITPREDQGGKMGGSISAKAGGKGERPVVKVPPKFSNVDSINPDSRGLNLQVKVISIEESSDDSCTSVVGDASGVVTMSLTGSKLTAPVKTGASLIIRNSFVRVVDGHINLQVDRFGKVEASDSVFDFQPNTSYDVSAEEYELVWQENTPAY